MGNTTVVIPVGPGHSDLSFQAIDSVKDQTIDAELIVIHDSEGKGPGWARNRALDQVQTRYTLFLDADDWLVPEAVETFENAIAGDWYAFCDWYQGSKTKRAPDCAFCITEEHGIQFGHLITALLPTAWAREIGGFSETMSVMEDTDFWVKLRYVGKRAGRRVATPLVHYSADGWRSQQIIDRMEHGQPVFNELRETLRAEIMERYRGQDKTMGCCGQPGIRSDAPTNAKLENDVLVRPQWAGNRRLMGYASGRVYRGSKAKKMWIAPEDLRIMGNMFKAVKS